MCSDSPLFDRYHHYATVGRVRVDVVAVPLVVRVHERRAGTGTCAGSAGPNFGDLRGLVRVRLDPGPAQGPGRGPGVLPDRARQHREALAPVGRVRLAARRLRRRVVPERLLGVVPLGRQGGQPAGADDQRDLAEGLDAAPDGPRRPPRHDDELPLPRRGPRAARAAAIRPEGLRRQRPPDQRQRLRRPARVDARGLPGRDVLLADEPPRQPRHRAPAAGR